MTFIRSRMYVIYGVTSYVGFLLVFTGMASSTWAERSSGFESSQWGLLATCSHYPRDARHVCRALDFGRVPAWLDGVRVLSGMSLVAVFSVLPLCLYLHFQDGPRNHLLPLTLFTVAGAACGLLAAIVFAASLTTSQGELSWGFAIFVSGHVFALVACLSLCALGVCQCLWKRQPAVKPFYL